MTLIVSVLGRESIWMLADRRLSYPRKLPKDDGRKLMFLETTDGQAILGYAGLGATALGTEPSDWMSAVFRGRNFTMEQSLSALTNALKKEFPPHMRGMPRGIAQHSIIVPALVADEPRFYAIDLQLAPDRKRATFRYVRLILDTPRPRTPRLAYGGSAFSYLHPNRKKWMRPLLRAVAAYERGQISDGAVANHLAELNDEAQLHIHDKTVGPRCIVAWRNSKGGSKGGGGGHRLYTNAIAEDDTVAIPMIANGIDVQALVKVIAPSTMKMLDAMLDDKPVPEVDQDEINAAVARLPYGPDEKLR
jgi:hypothetical protein